jgi:hypothetical protein
VAAAGFAGSELVAWRPSRCTVSRSRCVSGLAGKARPNPHKVLAVKRKHFPRPRGLRRFSGRLFLRVHSSGGEGHRSATRLGYRRRTRLLAPKAKDEPHPTHIRTPAARPRKAGRESPARQLNGRARPFGAPGVPRMSLTSGPGSGLIWRRAAFVGRIANPSYGLIRPLPRPHTIWRESPQLIRYQGSRRFPEAGESDRPRRSVVPFSPWSNGLDAKEVSS